MNTENGDGELESSIDATVPAIFLVDAGSDLGLDSWSGVKLRVSGLR